MSPGSRVLTLLRPKWLLLHVLTVAACLAMLWLGRWQWRAAIRHHGELLNYGYAFQWWAFVGFTLLMWFRAVTDHLGKLVPGGPPAPPAPAPARYVGYVAAPSVPAVETDPERLRFNAYLASLNQTQSRGNE